MAQRSNEDTESVLFSKHGMLHCGAEIISDKELRKIETPRRGGRFCGLPHHQLADEAIEQLGTGGYEVNRIEHSVTYGGDRYFGLIEMKTPEENGGGELSRIIGLRNAHDMSLRAQVVTGTGVFVCDNLSFNGQIEVGRRHTTHILRDMPILMGKAVRKMGEVWVDSETRVEAYKDRKMETSEVHDLVCRAMKMGYLTTSKIKPLLEEYKRPRHSVFAPDNKGKGNVWGLFNAYTEMGKAWPLKTVQDRTMGIHGLLDGFCDLNLKVHRLSADALEVDTQEGVDVIVTAGGEM